MFDKEKFGNIIKKINDSYPTQYDFADNSNVNRTYLSQYINKKLSSPPKPNILKKIAYASNGITTYDELMQVCGYLKKSNNETNIAKRIFKENLSILEKYHLSDDDLLELEKMLIERKEDNDDIDKQLNNFADHITIENFDSDLSIKDFASDIFHIDNDIKYIIEHYQKTEYEYPIPLYKNILIDKIGYLDKFNSHPIKYINLNIELNKISELIFCFGLVISDNSMAPLLDINDVAIIHETTQYNSNGTYLLQINNNPPIIRKIIETSSGLELHAMNMWNFPIQKNIKLSDINVIGKVIRAENQSAFK